MTTQNDLAQFLNDLENIQNLNRLVEDIRYAFMDYQVRTPGRLTLTTPNACLRLPYNETSTTRAVS